jgi:hypothetical protein
MPPELFFPLAGQDTEAAKAVCRGCPVRAECLGETMRTERPRARWGVYGGLDPDERDALAGPQERRKPGRKPGRAYQGMPTREAAMAAGVTERTIMRRRAALRSG